MYLVRPHLFTLANYITCFAVAVTFFRPATGYPRRRKQALNADDRRGGDRSASPTSLPGDYLTRFMFRLYCDRSRGFFYFPAVFRQSWAENARQPLRTERSSRFLPLLRLLCITQAELYCIYIYRLLISFLSHSVNSGTCNIR